MRALVILLALAPGLLIGCGGDAGSSGETKGAEQAGVTGEGPSGELSERGIGSAQVGASSSEVEQVFGAPDRQQHQPGCELDGPNATPILQWTWNLADGAVVVDFDARSRLLTSYRTSSPSFPTQDGVRIGDSFDTLSQSYGPLLRPLNIGSESSTPDSGNWYVGKPGRAWLLFSVAGGSIRTVQGGAVQICE